MQLTILRMISNGSLSAFSASIAQPGGIGPLNTATAVQRVRAQAPSQSSGMSATSSGRPMPPPVQPGQVLPRGSLLDLSV